MKPDNQAAVLRHAAARARARPEFLARVLAVYQEIEGMTERHLREHLGVTVANWPRLQLCLRPRAEAFLDDVTQIAERFGIDRAVLAAVIRRVDAVEIIQRREQPGLAGTLLAARTRKANAVLAGRRNAPMNDSELERLAAEFWADTHLGDVFPRNIEQAIALKLPVTVVKLPVVTIRAIARWLRRHNRSPVFPLYNRDLMGCLYADSGHGFIFLCGADEPEEQRLTLAHDVAHFLVDYSWPRLLVIQAMGDSIVDVLDGNRQARPGERASAVLARVRLGPHWHLLPRPGADPECDPHIACVEERADDLGRELVASPGRVLQMLCALPRRRRFEPQAACHALGLFFGVPPYVFHAEVAAMHREHTPSFLEDVRRVLGR